MAYTRKFEEAIPLPIEPAVISVYVPNSIDETNITVDIPWDNCELVYATSTVVTAIDNTGAMEVDIELDSGGGTELMTMSVAQNAAVGTQTEATFTTAASCRNLMSTNNIVIEVDGSSTGTGAIMMFLYFERTSMV